MSNSNQCSPLPWVVSYTANHVFVESALRHFVCERVRSDIADADAELIVRAVNCHDELLAALEECVEVLSFLETRTSVRTNPPTLEKARAAIAKAKS